MALEDKYQGSYVDGVFITEDILSEGHKQLGAIKVTSQRMNSNLAELKKKLARAARLKGANVIMSYKYGQKRTLLSLWDDTMWYASGIAAKLDDHA